MRAAFRAAGLAALLAMTIALAAFTLHPLQSAFRIAGFRVTAPEWMALCGNDMDPAGSTDIRVDCPICQIARGFDSGWIGLAPPDIAAIGPHAIDPAPRRFLVIETAQRLLPPSRAPPRPVSASLT